MLEPSGGTSISIGEGANSEGGTENEVEALLSLSIIPQITYDGNIMLDVTVTNNTIDGFFGSYVLTNRRDTRTRIQIIDGGTVVFGGIITEDETKGESRVPGLGSLPLLGHLFRSSTTTRMSRDVMFIITPTILR